MSSSSSYSSSYSSSGMGFFGLLTITFIVLKLTKIIDWSWFWVLFPLIPVTIIILGLIGIFVFMLIHENNMEKRKRKLIEEENKKTEKEILEKIKQN